MLLLLLSHFSHVQLCATPQMAATRLPRPWDSPGKNTGVGCHFLLQCRKVKSESEVTQLCPTFQTPWTAAHQAPPSMGVSRQEYWSGLPLPSLASLLLNHILFLPLPLLFHQAYAFCLYVEITDVYPVKIDQKPLITAFLP